VETQVHVYRVESLANPKNKFRVDINAQENRLSGEWCLLFISAIFSALFLQSPSCTIVYPFPILSLGRDVSR
jgi:hypothetical protein